DTLYNKQEICTYSPNIVVNLIYGFVTHIAINLKNEATLPENACKEFKTIFSDFLMGIKQSSINAKNHK
ncbi:TetR/AcrR family transcriptional regulator, partial [Proteus terrae]|nr:TetR/AcrR family transcriptional regulator [Proteus terrae]